MLLRQQIRQIHILQCNIWEHNMDYFTQITNIYPELTSEDFEPIRGSILLKDDGDGIQYIEKWEYSKPIPEGMKVGK